MPAFPPTTTVQIFPPLRTHIYGGIRPPLPPRKYHHPVTHQSPLPAPQRLPPPGSVSRPLGYVVRRAHSHAQAPSQKRLMRPRGASKHVCRWTKPPYSLRPHIAAPPAGTAIRAGESLPARASHPGARGGSHSQASTHQRAWLGGQPRGSRQLVMSPPPPPKTPNKQKNEEPGLYGCRGTERGAPKVKKGG